MYSPFWKETMMKNLKKKFDDDLANFYYFSFLIVLLFINTIFQIMDSYLIKKNKFKLLIFSIYLYFQNFKILKNN